MCAYHIHAAYQETESELSARNGYVHLHLHCGKHSSNLHLTLNLMQAQILGKHLQRIAEEIPLSSIGQDGKLFGGMTVEFADAGDPKECHTRSIIPIKAA